ncbi:ionotropic receptor 75a-like [Condylostylus longicornis]|uniref:ionotropic receptor 75a-like n=1 Tax=Condylostylus longicornis TaxID=2530218 RepID=UPI00244E428D|nr:ionotropic receptor 75a-like [Condylostylus longicornis]
MELFHLFSLITSHFLQSNVTHLTVANCWDIRETLLFNEFTRNNLMFVKFHNLNITERNAHNFKAKFCSNNYLPQVGIILDFDCTESYNIIKLANLTPFCFSANYKWLIFSKFSVFDNFYNIFKDASLFVDTEINFLQFSNGMTYFNITETIKNYDVYNNGRTKGGKLNITLESIAVFNSDNQTIEIQKTNLTLQSKYKNRLLLNDLVLRMGTVIVSKEHLQSKETIIAYLESSNNTHVEPFSRLGYKYEKLLQDIFQYKIEIVVYDKWSTNGSAGGAFGAIVDGQDDLSGVLFTLYPGRMAKAHFVIQLGEFRSVFFFRTPRSEGLTNYVFLKPFSKLVWIAMLLTILITTILLYKIFKVERNIFSNFQFLPSYFTLLLNSVAVLCQQDSYFIPKTAGGRTVLLTIFIFSYILNQYYASVIISSLLSTPLKTNIKTLEQLADSKLDVGFEPIVYIYEFLKSNTSSVKYFTNKRVNLQNPNPKQFPDARKGISLIRQGDYAYHAEATTAVRLIEELFTPEEICDLNEVPLRGDFPASIPINQKSPFIEMRRQKYLLLLEIGLIDKHRKQWMKSRVRCFSKSNVGTVGMEYAEQLIMVLIIGIFASVLLLIIEVFINCFYKKYYPHAVPK